MYAYQFRLIVVGDSTVGKSSLLRYFCDGKFCDDSDPTVRLKSVLFFNIRNTLGSVFVSNYTHHRFENFYSNLSCF